MRPSRACCLHGGVGLKADLNSLSLDHRSGIGLGLLLVRLAAARRAEARARDDESDDTGDEQDPAGDPLGDARAAVLEALAARLADDISEAVVVEALSLAVKVVAISAVPLRWGIVDHCGDLGCDPKRLEKAQRGLAI